jgi:hypothetical protein
MKEAFIAEIEAAVEKGGFSDRSVFIRAAVLEELRRLGFKVPASLASAPYRMGKGGRKKEAPEPVPGVRYVIAKTGPTSLNEGKGRKKK